MTIGLPIWTIWIVTCIVWHGCLSVYVPISKVEKNYAIVVDAGSSKTSMLLYQWERKQDNGQNAFKIDQISKCKAKGKVCIIINLIF